MPHPEETSDSKFVRSWWPTDLQGWSRTQAQTGHPSERPTELPQVACGGSYL
jgi:hypothetical protein